MDMEYAGLDAAGLRAQLMAPDPMQRAMALHAIELRLSRTDASADPTLTRKVEHFAARGIPFYAPHDRHFCNWVGRAVAYWEQLRRDA